MHTGDKTSDIFKIMMEVSNGDAEMRRPGFSSTSWEKYYCLTTDTLIKLNDSFFKALFISESPYSHDEKRLHVSPITVTLLTSDGELNIMQS